MAEADGCERRAAFDLGSGAMKVQVSDVDVAGQRIVKTVYATMETVLLAEDVLKHGGNRLSDAILATAFDVCKRFVDKARALGCRQCRGVATAIFRKVDNGTDFLERLRTDLGLDVRIIPQDLEGKIGFFTAAANSGADDLSHVVSWDSGGASFQFAREAVATPGAADAVYLGPIGTSIVTKVMVEDIQGKNFAETQSANPATAADAEKIVARARGMTGTFPAWLRDMVAKEETRVVAIGSTTSIFNLLATIAGKTQDLTRADAEAALKTLLGKTDAELAEYPEVHMVVPKICLIMATMDELGISRFSYVASVGGCPGVLLSPEFWDAEDQDD